MSVHDRATAANRLSTNDFSFHSGDMTMTQVAEPGTLNVDPSMEDALRRLVLDEGLSLRAVRDLRWQDIHWDVHAVVLRPPCSRRCLIGLALSLPESALRPHRHLSPSTVETLNSLCERDIMRKVRSGLSWYPTEPVLTTRDGQLLDGAQLAQWGSELNAHANGREWGATPPFESSP